jgi:hypothetical protein
VVLAPEAIVLGFALKELIVGEARRAADVASCAGALPVMKNTTTKRAASFTNNCVLERN